MKQLFLFICVLFATCGFSQTMQGTIKAGSSPGTVDIYIKPSASFSRADESMSFALAVPATITPAPSMGSSGVTSNGTGPVSGISGLQPNFLVNNQGSLLREVVVSMQSINGINHFIYTFLFAVSSTNVHTWIGGVEQKIFSIQFNGCTANCVTNILLVSLANGGSNSDSYWYFQANVLGDITNYSAPFYSTVSSTAANNGGSPTGSALSTIGLASPIALPVSGNICPQGNTSIYAGTSESSKTYQWQVDNGAGFTNVTDNPILSGTNTPTLTLTNVPSTWYGYKFRSLISDSFGTVFSQETTIKFSSTWIGTSSTSWENGANWSCGMLPDENTDVIINSGVSLYPVLNSNTSIRSLIIKSGATVRVSNGFNLNITGK